LIWASVIKIGKESSANLPNDEIEDVKRGIIIIKVAYKLYTRGRTR
jgi:hypothetical protein